MYGHQKQGIMTLEEAQKEVDRWIKTYGVRYFSELTNMAVLTEEVGELARVMARKYGDQSFKQGEKDNLADEMADVLWVLICLANQTILLRLRQESQRAVHRHIALARRLGVLVGAAGAVPGGKAAGQVGALGPVHLDMAVFHGKAG